MFTLSYAALAPYYELRDSTIKKEVVFEVSRYYTEKISDPENKGSKWRPWDRVARNVYLGKLPLLSSNLFSTTNQHEQIIQTIETNHYGDGPLGLVVSVVDYFELAAYSVVTPKDWEQKKIPHLMLPMSDFSAVAPNESIIAIVKAMRKCVEEGKSVYIHCKAGRSRSAMLCAIYLALYGNDEDLKPAAFLQHDETHAIENYLLKKRPQVDFDNEKREKIAEIVNLMRQDQQEQQVDTAQDTPTLKQFLSSVELKNAIIHFSSFKKLALYGCLNQGYVGQSKVNSYIRDFFKKIYTASDESWYRDLINGTGPMHQLVHENAYHFYIWNNESDKTMRKILRNEFINELNHYLTQRLKCTNKDIKNVILELGARHKM